VLPSQVALDGTFAYELVESCQPVYSRRSLKGSGWGFQWGGGKEASVAGGKKLDPEGEKVVGKALRNPESVRFGTSVHETAAEHSYLRGERNPGVWGRRAS